MHHLTLIPSLIIGAVLILMLLAMGWPENEGV